jgi:hypothetical protein
MILNPLFLARRLLSVLLKRVCGVRAQTALGVIGLLLRASGDGAALVVDVAARLAGLGLGLVFGLWGLAAGVWCRHCDVGLCGTVWGYVRWMNVKSVDMMGGCSGMVR